MCSLPLQTSVRRTPSTGQSAPKEASEAVVLPCCLCLFAAANHLVFSLPCVRLMKEETQKIPRLDRGLNSTFPVGQEMVWGEVAL